VSAGGQHGIFWAGDRRFVKLVGPLISAGKIIHSTSVPSGAFYLLLWVNLLEEDLCVDVSVLYFFRNIVFFFL
jgi:hypothetical protein